MKIMKASKVKAGSRGLGLILLLAGLALPGAGTGPVWIGTQAARAAQQQEQPQGPETAAVAIDQGGGEEQNAAVPWEEPEEQPIADPLEPVNRIFFQFNDKLYFWLLNPMAKGYAKVVPKDVRLLVRNAFHNLLAPVRIVNNLLQGKLKGCGIELCRFAINSTFGIGGLTDLAASDFKLAESDEDLGQTLGVYGAGPGIYLNWPILGPSSLRDTAGLAGDAFLDPLSYASSGHFYTGAGIYAGKRVNQVSLHLGDYEQFKETSLDPYAALRDAYHQYRQGRVRDADKRPEAASPPPVALAPAGGQPVAGFWQSDKIGLAR